MKISWIWKGDVYDNWSWLLRIACVSHQSEEEDEEEIGSRSRLHVKRWTLVKNSLACLWFIGQAIRISFSGYIETENHHLRGHTLIGTGSIYKLIIPLSGFVSTECCLYRVAVLCLTLTGDWKFLQIIKRMTREQDYRLREQKVKVLRYTFVVALIAMIAFLLPAVAILSLAMVVNVRNSSLTVAVAWIFWWMVDVILILTSACDAILFPVIWILSALDYRLQLMHLLQMIGNILRSGNTRFRANGPLDVVMTIALRDISLRAQYLNRSASPILFILILYTTPIAVFCSFVSSHTDYLLIAFGLPVAGLAILASACALLALAADLTAKSEKVYASLSTLAFRRANLPLDRRVKLLHIMEECGSKEQPLALYNMTGEKYTHLTFAEYLVETAIQYTLLVSFVAYWNLTSDSL